MDLTTQDRPSTIPGKLSGSLPLDIRVVHRYRYCGQQEWVNKRNDAVPRCRGPFNTLAIMRSIVLRKVIGLVTQRHICLSYSSTSFRPPIAQGLDQAQRRDAFLVRQPRCQGPYWPCDRGHSRAPGSDHLLHDRYSSWLWCHCPLNVRHPQDGANSHCCVPPGRYRRIPSPGRHPVLKRNNPTQLCIYLYSYSHHY